MSSPSPAATTTNHSNDPESSCTLTHLQHHPPTAACFVQITLNFAVAHSAVVNNKPATRVTVPGRGGTVGIEAKAPPFLTELRPGVVSIEYEKGETESFFVPGGFAFNHKGSKVDVSAPDVAKPEDIDVDALRQRFEEAKQAFDVAAAGSQEQAKASIELEVFKAIGAEVNMKL